MIRIFARNVCRIPVDVGNVIWSGIGGGTGERLTRRSDNTTTKRHFSGARFNPSIA